MSEFTTVTMSTPCKDTLSTMLFTGLLRSSLGGETVTHVFSTALWGTATEGPFLLRPWGGLAASRSAVAKYFLHDLGTTLNCY